MPTPVKLTTYPAVYFQLFRKALLNPIVVPLNSRDEAIKLRAVLYGFRNALKAKAETPEEIELAITSGRLTFTLEATNLRIEDRQVSVATQQIQTALASINPTTDMPSGDLLSEDDLPDPD